MDELDELPTWAARTHVPGTNLPLPDEQEQEPGRRSFRWLLIGALGVIALGAVAGLGYVAASSIGGDGNETASADDTDADADNTASDDAAGTGAGSVTDGDETDAGDTSADASGDPTADADGGSTVDSTIGGDGAGDSDTDATADGSGGDAESDVTAPRGGDVVDNSDGSIRYAVLEGGKLYLRGRVHTEEFGRAVEEVALGVMGPGNVINEYEVDPSTPDVTGGPIYVDDVVLFEFNSIAIADPFLPILDLGTLLMTQNPTVTIQVITRTDSVGSEAANLEVAQLRGDAIVRYWQRQGIDPARITVVPKGEEDASGDEAEAALDRRAEFVIDNLFG